MNQPRKADVQRRRLRSVQYAIVASQEQGAQDWAIPASLIKTSKLSGAELYGYLTPVLTAIVNGHRQNKIEERPQQLMEWHDSALNWDYPPDPGPWTKEQYDEFDLASLDAMCEIRRCLGPVNRVINNDA